MYGIKAIISKELTRVFKDKKMVMSLFVFPVVMVVGLFALLGVLIKGQTEDVEGHMPVVYVQDAPESFKEFLAAAEIEGVNLVSGSGVDMGQLKDEVLNGTVDLILAFPAGFEEAVGVDMSQLSKVTVPKIEVYYNPSEDYSQEAFNIYQSYLEVYKQALLGARFGDYSAVRMFELQENYIQDDNKAVGKMLGMMLPYFITMLIFAGAMGLGVDMIAGEKERGTLASMLLSPVNRQQIVLGKVFALAILAVLSAAVYVISMVIALPVLIKSMGAGDSLGGLSINFTSAQIVQIVVLMLGVVILYVSIICMVAVFAKNVKEASSYITPVYLIVLVAGFITMYGSAEGVLYKYLIPVYGSSMAFKDILTMEITMPNFLAAAVSTYVVAGLLVVIMTRAFNSEKVMFNA